MNLALTPTQRKRADALIRATAKDGADATAQGLRHFPADAWPALVAYLARVAAEARVTQMQRQRPRFTPEQRRAAHYAYTHGGERTIEAVLGEREYQRMWRRQQRGQAS